MQLRAFQLNIRDNIAHIRLDQAEKGNPFNADFCEEFNELSIICGESPDIRTVYIDAAGTNFSVGGDLKQFLVEPEALPANFKRMTANLHMGIARFARNDAPLIVGAHNLVVGGAVALVAAADFVYAAPKTQFYAAFSAVGMSGDTGITHYLPRRVGSRKAAEFLLLNEMWSADKAAETGLINGVVDQETLEEHCFSLAAKLAGGPTAVYGRMRRLLLSSFDQSIDTQLEMEARGMVECAHSAEAIEAMRAILKQ